MNTSWFRLHSVRHFSAAIAIIALGVMTANFDLVANNVWTIGAKKAFMSAKTDQTIPLNPGRYLREALWRGRVALQQGKAAEAQAFFEQQLQTTPGDKLATAGLGESLLAQGDFLGGSALLEQVGAVYHLKRAGWLEILRQHYGNALTVYAAAHRLSSQDADVVSSLALAQSKVGRTSDAIQLLEEAIQATSDPRKGANWALDLARVYEEQGSLDRAIEVYRDVVRRYPDNAVAHARLGRAIYQLSGDFESAVVLSEEAIDLDRTNFYAYWELGELYLERGEYVLATPLLKQAVELAPDSGPPLYALATAATKSGDPRLAVHLLENGLAKLSYDPAIYFNLAIACRAAGDFPCAHDAIYRALDAVQSDEWYWLLAGEIDEQSGLTADAIEAYKMALGINGSNQAARDGLTRLRQ